MEGTNEHSWIIPAYFEARPEGLAVEFVGTITVVKNQAAVEAPALRG